MGRGVFQKKDKTIKFNKEMANCIFGFSSGNIPFVFDSTDTLVKEEVKSISEVPFEWANYYEEACKGYFRRQQ
jgi:hypothetical protein